MTDSPLLLLLRRAILVEDSGKHDPIAYDDARMMNMPVVGGTPVHASNENSAQGSTRKTAVGRETTDDR